MTATVGASPHKAKLSNGSGKSNTVRVVARIRPLAGYEKENGSRQVISALPSSSTTVSGLDAAAGGPTTETEMLQVDFPGLEDGKRWYELDAVFDGNSTQRDVYVKSGAQNSVCEVLFQGYNCTILAYGQTGSGKTFTMGTAGGGTLSDAADTDGVIPRACFDLFESIETKCDGNAQVTLSYLEIYNEEIRDLMSPTDCSSQLRIRETLHGEVYVSGLESRSVANPQEIGKYMEEASGRRVVASTKMNAVSSRSHAICVLRINGVLEDSTKFQSKLTLVDLAGSERIKKTGAQGNRRQEGININKGLFVLGQVVSALAEQRPRMKRKPPYRDSKLTRLLQDSLGGNSQTIMVACVSPADFNMDESMNTLRYATCARNIKNSATKNFVKRISQEEAAKMLRENQLLKKEVQELQETILRMTMEISPVTSPAASVSDEDQSIASEDTIPGADGTDEVTCELSEETIPSTEGPEKDTRELLANSLDSTDEDTLQSIVSKITEDPVSHVRYEETGAHENMDDALAKSALRIAELEQEVEKLRQTLRKAKGDIRASMRMSAIELPAMKTQVAFLQEELKETRVFEEENEDLRIELVEVKAEAASARLAANKLSRLVESAYGVAGELASSSGISTTKDWRSNLHAILDLFVIIAVIAAFGLRDSVMSL
jgi:hypothetical protein